MSMLLRNMTCALAAALTILPTCFSFDFFLQNLMVRHFYCLALRTKQGEMQMRVDMVLRIQNDAGKLRVTHYRNHDKISKSDVTDDILWYLTANFGSHIHATQALLTHCGLVTSYGKIDHYWFREWLASWQHQAIARTNVNLLTKMFYGNHLREMWQKVLMSLIRNTWVRSWNCGCIVTWFCYHLIAKPGNKTAAVPWPDLSVTTTLTKYPLLWNYTFITLSQGPMS